LEHEDIDTDNHHLAVNVSSTPHRGRCANGLALGGAAGADLCHQIGIVVCGSTLLNHIKQLSLPKFATPKIMGVDDFAFCKGQRSGTILVDLERNQPIALLADRKAETLTDWLIQHPGVEILSRDRSKTYKSAMDKGAPAAIQVADRFHLVQNLEETLAQVFSSKDTLVASGLWLVIVSSVRAAQGLPPSRVKPTIGLPIAIDPQSPPLTKSRAAFLILKREENRDERELQLLDLIISQHSNLALAVELADEFLQLLRAQRADDFDRWLFYPMGFLPMTPLLVCLPL
jgi:hypothetical protein